MNKPPSWLGKMPGTIEECNQKAQQLKRKFIKLCCRAVRNEPILNLAD